MLRSKKYEVLEDLKGVYTNSKAIILTHYHGLTAADMFQLRRNLSEHEGKFRIVKNTISKIAIDNLNIDNKLRDIFKGPVAIAYSNDPVNTAKAIVNFSKEQESLKVLGAFINDAIVNASDIEKIASLPGLDQLRAQIIGALNAPATKIARALKGPGTKIATLLSLLNSTENTKNKD